MTNKFALATAGLLASAVATAAFAEGDTNALSQFTIGAYGSSVSFRLSDTSGDDFTAHGTGYGGSIQFAPSVSQRNNMLFIADYDHPSVSKNGVDITGDRFNITAGFMGGVGQQSHWFAGAKFSSHKLTVCGSSSCGSTTSSTTKTGFGVTGGFILPFAHQWTGRATLGYTRFGASDGDDALDEGVAKLGIEYRPTPLLGITAGIESSYYLDSDYSDNNFSLVSGRIGLNFHF